MWLWIVWDICLMGQSTLVRFHTPFQPKIIPPKNTEKFFLGPLNESILSKNFFFIILQWLWVVIWVLSKDDRNSCYQNFRKVWLNRVNCQRRVQIWKCLILLQLWHRWSMEDDCHQKKEWKNYDKSSKSLVPKNIQHPNESSKSLSSDMVTFLWIYMQYNVVT